MKNSDVILIIFIGFIIGVVAGTSIGGCIIGINTNRYVKENVITYDKLDSILDVRLGSGCDLYVDSCDICTE